MGEKKYLNIPSQILEERERGREERVSEKEEKKTDWRGQKEDTICWGVHNGLKRGIINGNNK